MRARIVTGPLQHPISARFDLLEEVGTGASGTVYRARTRERLRDLPAGSEVAVKFLRQDRLRDERARLQIEQEGELGLAVRSPFVARILAVETIDLLGLELTYLVMEYVRGKTLREFLLHSGPPVEDFARRIGADAARGLEALHRRGIVHRDVKPENLALTEAGQVKLMDLGLARRSGDELARPGEPSSGGFFGSLAYAAPETLRGQRAGPATDLYALGIVLFEIVTGRHPFQDAANSDAMIAAHLDRPPPRPSHLQPRVSSLLEDLILELLHKEPEQRMASARLVADTLAAGEASPWWREHERRAPVLASRRRARAMRRFAPTPFFDRDDALALLDRALRQLRAGTGAALRFVGPEGIGRRRLLDEWVEQQLAEQDDLVFFGGEPDPERTRRIGAPFTDLLLEWLLRGDAADSPLAQDRCIARALEVGFEPADAERLAALVLGAELGNDPAARALLVAQALPRIARPGRKLLLRIDRPERLDGTGQLVVARLAEQIRELPVLLLLVSGIEELGKEFAGSTHELRGLPEQPFLRFAVALFRAGSADSEVLRAAHGALGGSPGNLIEALEAFVARGDLTGTPGSFGPLPSGARIRPAEPLLHRLRRRVAGLPPAQRHVLLAAAVLGSRFRIADLAALVGQTELDVLQAISLFGGRVVRAVGGAGAFRHTDFRAALLETIPPAVRRSLYRSAAWLREERGGSPLEVGMLLSRAHEHFAAVEPLLAGLARLVEAGSRRSSLVVADRLRAHLAALGDEPRVLSWRLRFLPLAAAAAAQAERHQRARDDWRACYQLAEAAGDRIVQVQALTGLAQAAQNAGQYLSALHYLDRTEALLPQPTDTAARRAAALALGLHGRVLGYLGTALDALERLHRALELTPLDDDRTRAHLKVDLARLHALRGHFTIALRELDLAETIFQAASDPLGLLRVQLHRGSIHGDLGDLAAARGDLAAAGARARELHDVRSHGRAELFHGLVLARHDEPQPAIAHLRTAIDLATTAGDPLTRVLAHLELRSFGLLRQDLEQEIADLGLPVPRAWWLLLRAQELREGGDDASAASLLREARTIGRRVDLPFGLRVDLLVADDQAERARRLVRAVANRLPAGGMRRRFAQLWLGRIDSTARS